MSQLFLTDLQRQIAALPEDEKQAIKLLVIVNEKNEHRKLEFEIFRGERLEAGSSLTRRYILAMINNMLVSFGGAGITIYSRTGDALLQDILREVIGEFQVDKVRNDRTGYGVYLNYINKMNRFLGIGKFYMEVKDLDEWTEPDPAKEYRVYVPRDEEKELDLLRRSAVMMDGTCHCSLDVGGNSIKGAVVKDGKAVVLKEYSWYPTGITTAEETNGPQILMVRFLSACTGLLERDGNLDRAASGFDRRVPYDELLALTLRLEEEGIVTEGRFDSIVVGFYDIVVHGKIAGGESFKQLGMKNNPDLDYEIEFFKTSDLDDMVRPYVKADHPVVVMNDGNCASYIISVEQAFTDPENRFIDENGLFCNTVGTEMGTGFISRGGTIQHIPMEGFQHVIDLGSMEYQQDSFDTRSIRSVNTGISGVVQKYISQLALFREAVTPVFESGDPRMKELFDDGLMEYDKEKDDLHPVVKPVDMRGQLTRRLISWLSDPESSATEAFRTMGKALGILIDQDLLIYPEIKPFRLMSGGIINDDRAFKLLRDALKEYNPAYDVLRLDEETMYSPLLRSMTPEQRNFNVAIGSSYIGNRFLIEYRETGTCEYVR